MSRNTENKEELLKVHGSIDLINQRLDNLENNHLSHIQKDIDRIMYVISAIGLGLLGQFLYLLTKNI
jgi:Mg2+ and Co2+ transporter CorA|tara:strand:- start:620 stop:820 length:201 start_codon:yes stop_codon:yes gene_type:complete